MAAAGDLDGDGLDALAVLVPAAASDDAGATEVAMVFEGPVESGRLEEPTASVHGDPWHDLFWDGQGLLAAGDLDDDGREDLVIGYASFEAWLEEVRPAVHLRHGPLAGDVSLSDDAAVTLTVSPHPTRPPGEAIHPRTSGLALADVSGSGRRSLAVPTWDREVAVFLDLPTGGDLSDADLFLHPGTEWAGERSPFVGILAGPLDDGAVSLADAAVGITASVSDPWMESLAATDLDGDGVSDVVYGVGRPEPGRAYVLLGEAW